MFHNIKSWIGKIKIYVRSSNNEIASSYDSDIWLYVLKHTVLAKIWIIPVYSFTIIFWVGRENSKI